MTRTGWILASLLALPLLGILPIQAGWFSRPSSPEPAAEQITASTNLDPLHNADAERWRQRQPNHWRECVLQP